MNNMYMQNILDHFHHPENYGVLEDATVMRQVNNPFCGDKITLYLRIDGGAVKDLKFTGEGCAISQAAMSMLSSELIGKSLDELGRLDSEFVLKLVGVELSPTRMKCALLGWEGVKLML